MNQEDKRAIYSAYENGQLTVASASQDKSVEWKKILEVLKHGVKEKQQYVVELVNKKSCKVTEDHSLYVYRDDAIHAVKTREIDATRDSLVVLSDEEKVSSEEVKSVSVAEREDYMYDLSVEDNHNFFLASGILAHNSFRPPSHEKFIQAQTQVFGYIWEDYELYEYILMAVDLFNGAPPITDISMTNMPTRWRTTVIMRAAGFACSAVALNWIADEFSVQGDERITLKIDTGEEYSLTMREFFDVMYADKVGEIERQVKAGTLTIVKEFEYEDE